MVKKRFGINEASILTQQTQSSPKTVQLIQMASGQRSGGFNMALDEALLDWVRRKDTQPTLVLRTYGWEEPTLSLGVNQRERPKSDGPGSGESLSTLVNRYQRAGQPISRIVRRPTGGRAIRHGDDASFSVVTNLPELTTLTLNDSYGMIMGWVRGALVSLGIPVQLSSEKRGNGYMRSPVCFETQTPSDLLDACGKKLSAVPNSVVRGAFCSTAPSFSMRPIWQDGLTGYVTLQSPCSSRPC